MLENIKRAPSDPILGLTESFRDDPNPKKINLGVGVFKDAKGETPVLKAVKEAEKRLLTKETSKSYLGIEGDAHYGHNVRVMVFGEDSDILKTHRAITAHTPGGTGALRVAAEFIKANLPGASLWMSDPTWENHPKVFSAAGLETKTYSYFDPGSNGIRKDAFLSALNQIPSGDILLLHACCHNPCGVDPDTELWKQIAEIIAERNILPLLDFAYQGFGDGLEEDAIGVRTIAERVPEFLVASSFSKNFGLYRERVGGLTVVAKNTDAAQIVLSQIKTCIRTNYSNPPAHGAFIVNEILDDPELNRMWQDELREMRNRINGMRRLFVRTLRDKGVERDFSFIEQQRGMFSFSGLNPDQVDRLRDDYAIYIVKSGRINVAGMTEKTIDYFCDAIAAVV